MIHNEGVWKGRMDIIIWELNKIKEDEMKTKRIKEYKRRLQLILKSKLNEKKQNNTEQ